MGSSTPPRHAYAALLALALAGCAEPLVAATADASSDAAAEDLPPPDGAQPDAMLSPDATPPPDAPPPDVVRAEAPDADTPGPDVRASPDVVVDAPPDVASLACAPRDAAVDDAADVPLTLGQDVVPGACAADGEVQWYSRAAAPPAPCVMCVCRGGSYRCDEGSPDAAPLVTPVALAVAAPPVTITGNGLPDGRYELVAARWFGGCPRVALRPVREVVTVQHAPASHTYFGFTTREDGGAVERSLAFAREFEGGPIFIARWCPTSVGSFAGVSLQLEVEVGRVVGFTLYQPENTDGTGPVLARTFRRVA